MPPSPESAHRVLRRREVKANILLDQQLKVESQRKRALRRILKKAESQWTGEERLLIKQWPVLVKDIKRRFDHAAKCRQRKQESSDDMDTLKQKCRILAESIISARNVVVYTGAGISTAANIPDYRGPNGVWTVLRKTGVKPTQFDISSTEPTYSHMALGEMVSKGMVKHVVSQNCDGLHVRSGIPSEKLSEIHGNMFVEYCSSCSSQVWRDFDVSLKSRRHCHETGRRCQCCKEGKLKDTIVHFGETGKLDWPLNWSGAIESARKADLIICFGTSLTVLRRYSCLWPKDKKYKLFVVNLQWTPKDSAATLKLNGTCDSVFRNLVEMLKIKPPEYKKSQDPLLHLFTPLSTDELSSTRTNRIFGEGYYQPIQQTCNAWFGTGVKVKEKKKKAVGQKRIKKEEEESCAVDAHPQK